MLSNIILTMLQTIGSKKRLEILKLLSQKDHYVSQIMEQSNMDGKRAKHHLNILEEEGLVKSYWEGQRKYYALIKEVKLEIVPPPEGKFLIYKSEDDD